MHKHHFVHLDISAHNILTDYNGHCAFIDFERSRRFISTDQPILRNYRGTEVPPEYERQGYYDPYKVDIWALGILISRACKVRSDLSNIRAKKFMNKFSQLDMTLQK
jgi:serine/threonine protein kinase